MLSTWVVLVLAVAGCAPSQDAPRAGPTTGSSAAAPAATPGAAASAEAPQRGTTRTEGVLIATATVDQVEAFAEPDDRGEPTHALEHPTEVGAPRVFLVDDRRDGWLHVLLPVRPNGTTGWIRESDVELTRTSYRVEVRLGDFLLRVHRDDEVVLETTIGYGAEDTPTPGGRYYLTELLQPPDPGGLYGPYAFGLSGFSEVHRNFAGGEGVIGIHGTNDPSSLGRRVSNGCIRIENDAITELASTLPLGTPVTIEP